MIDVLEDCQWEAAGNQYLDNAEEAELFVLLPYATPKQKVQVFIAGDTIYAEPYVN